MDKKTKKVSLITTGVAVVAIIALVVVLTILMVTSSNPKKSVDGLLTNLKAGDFEKAQEFMTGDGLVEEDAFNEEGEKYLFDKLSWKITNITEEKENATIELEITNKDFKTIITNYSQKILKLVFGGENVTEETAGNYLVEELKNEGVQMTTATKTIQAVKEDGKWKIVGNDDLTNALLPGLQDAMNAFQAGE